MVAKVLLFWKTYSELQEICTENNFPNYTAKQMAEWLYQKGVSSIDEMTDISITDCDVLKEKYQVG